MLQRLSGSLAQSLRLSSRHFAAYQQHAAFHLSASLDARRQQQDGSGSDSDDSDDEQENPKPQQHVESEGVSDDLLPRFDASYARNPGDCCRCRRHPCRQCLPLLVRQDFLLPCMHKTEGLRQSALRWRSRPSGCACSCRSRLQPRSAPFPAPSCEANHLQLPCHLRLANVQSRHPRTARPRCRRQHANSAHQRAGARPLQPPLRCAHAHLARARGGARGGARGAGRAGQVRGGAGCSGRQAAARPM